MSGSAKPDNNMVSFNKRDGSTVTFARRPAQPQPSVAVSKKPGVSRPNRK